MRIIRLELVHLVLLVAKLLKGTGQLTLVLGADLVSGDGVHEAGGAADKQLDVLVLGLRENSLEQLLGDIAAVADPLLGGVVEDIESTETLGECVLEVLKLLLQKNVLLGDVAKDKGDLGLVVGVVEDSASELIHGGDASTTGNEGNVLVLVLLPGVLRQRTLDVEALAGNKVVEVCAHRTVGVLLNEQVDETLLACNRQSAVLRRSRSVIHTLITDRGVGSESSLLVVGTLVLCKNSTGNVQTRDLIRLGKLKA